MVSYYGKGIIQVLTTAWSQAITTLTVLENAPSNSDAFHIISDVRQKVRKKTKHKINLLPHDTKQYYHSSPSSKSVL